MTDHLLRRFAPITEAAWAQIDAEAKSRITSRLAGRRLVDWAGPHGWDYSATPLGRVHNVEPAADVAGEQVRSRQVLPVTEFRVPFTVARAELDDVDRGAPDIELADLDRAAARIAECENAAILIGWPAAGIRGITAASAHPAGVLGPDPLQYPHAVAAAVETLRSAGIEGPFALAIEPDRYTRILESSDDGGPLLDHLRQVLGDGEVVRAPGVAGAVVLSQRGGDFVLEVGQDLSIGYSAHDAQSVELYLEESFTFRVLEPDAGVALS